MGALNGEPPKPARLRPCVGRRDSHADKIRGDRPGALFSPTEPTFPPQIQVRAIESTTALGHAQLPDSRTRGWKAGRFSFNVKGGRCEACQGDGTVKVEMHFLADVYVACDACQGKRYNEQTLSVAYKGHHIADVLALNISACLELFGNHRKHKRILQTLIDVGLGYVKIGQTATTMSGGESQRVKLSRELGKVQTGRTLYVLDEPTTGLHFEDISRLLGVLQRFVELLSSMSGVGERARV